MIIPLLEITTTMVQNIAPPFYIGQAYGFFAAPTSFFQRIKIRRYQIGQAYGCAISQKYNFSIHSIIHSFRHSLIQNYSTTSTSSLLAAFACMKIRWVALIKSAASAR